MKIKIWVVKVLLLVLCTVVYNKCAAQYILSGKILNPYHKPAEFAVVHLIPNALTTYSDSIGQYSFKNLSLGTYKIKVSMMGYFTQEQQITLHKDTVLNFVLQENPAVMQETVISGTLYPVSKSESPVLVETYNLNFFQANPANNVFEAMQNINGVRPQVNCNVCSTGDIHINGMEGPYTMVLLDGMPIVSGLATVYGLMGIPASLIEQVEVVKGANSTLYGSEAVAGTINIITKSPEKAPKLSIETFSSDWKDFNMDIGMKNKLNPKTYNLLSINYFNYQQRIDKNKDGFTDIPLQHRIALFDKISIENKEKDEVLTLATRYLYEDRWGGQTQWNRTLRGSDSIYGESIFTHRAEVIGTYSLPYLKNKVKVQFSANVHYQNSMYGTTFLDAQQQIYFAQILYQNAFKNHFFTTGTAYRYTYYDDNTIITQEYKNAMLYNRPVRTILPGFFLQDECKIHKKQTLLAGIRYDYHNKHGNIFSPRVAYKYASLDKKHTFRASAGNGFRVVNVFTEDHAALTGAREVVFAASLKPETSWSGQLSYVYKNYLWNMLFITLDAGAFYTYFTNKIIPDYTDANKIIYDNLAGYAISRGMNTNVNLIFENGFSANIGFTRLDVYFVKDNQKQKPLLTEPYSAVWTLKYENKKRRFSIDYTGNLYGPMKLPLLSALDTRPGYSPVWTIQNVQVTKKWHSTKRFEVFGGIKNLFDFVSPAYSIARAHDPFDKNVIFDSKGNVIPSPDNPQALTFDTSYVFAPNQGRRVFLGIRYTM